MQFTPSTLLYFLFLIIGGHILLPIVLAAFTFCGKVHRNPTFVSWMITWVIYSISMCLLLYSGPNLVHDSEQPPQNLCLIQAALNYASVVLCTVGASMFVINVWLSIRSIALQEAQSYAERRSWRYFSIVFPYATFVVVLLVVSIVGAANPASVSRDETSFFCSVDLPVVRGVQGVAAIGLLVVLYFEGLVAVPAVSNAQKKGIFKVEWRSCAFIPSLHTNCLFHFVHLFGNRLTAINIVFRTAILIWVRTTHRPYLTFSYLVLSTVPLAVFVMFGTQRDLLGAYKSGILSTWNFVVGTRDIFEVKRIEEDSSNLDKPLPPFTQYRIISLRYDDQLQ